MKINSDIRVVFAPLGMRLHFFEANIHLTEDNEHDFDVNRHDYNYISMMDKIGKEVNYFDAVEVSLIADEYIDRTIEVYLKLKKQKKSNRKIKPNKWRLWMNEVEEYLTQLFSIVDARKEANKKNQSKSEDSLPPIRLPESFKVSDFVGVYTPRFSTKQATLILFFLRAQGYIPKYTDTDLATLAKVFFGRNDQNVRSSFGKINSIISDKKELGKLKDFLSSMITEIETNYFKK